MEHMQDHYVRCGDLNTLCNEECKHCAGMQRRLEWEEARNTRRISKGLEPLPEYLEFKLKCEIR